MSNKVALGVDVGGTNVKAGLVSADGKLIALTSWPTESQYGFSHFVAALKHNITALAHENGLSWSDIDSVGLGLPGFLDLESNLLIHAVNLGWADNVPVVSLLQSELNKPVVMDNDANLAALGEVWIGAGRGAKSALCITLGTGVGAGIIIDGHVYRGVSSMAGEIGHIPMKVDGELCNCGQRGCLETLVSATALARIGAQAGLISPKGEVGTVSCEDVFHLAKTGDSAAQELIDNMIDWLARGLTIAANILNPQVIVISGGVVHAGEALFQPLQKLFSEYALHRVADSCRVLPAELGSNAGVLGAARLAWQNIGD